MGLIAGIALVLLMFWLATPRPKRRNEQPVRGFWYWARLFAVVVLVSFVTGTVALLTAFVIYGGF